MAKLEESPSVLEVLNTGSNYHLGPVSARSLQKMIEQPAEVTGYKFESNLVDMIIDEAGKEPGNLPLVAYTLKQLFEHRRERTFTFAAYEEIGGIVGAIGTKADEVMNKLGSDTIASFDRVFAELVHLVWDRPPTRKRVSMKKFTDDSEAITLIQALGGQDCRILVIGQESGDASIQVAHERLFSAWPRLKEWLDDSGEALRLIDHATNEAIIWASRNDSPDELWQITKVREVEKALKRFGKHPIGILNRFLKPQKVLLKQLSTLFLPDQRRAEIGKKLDQFGDPRPGVGLGSEGLPDIAWIEIPPGQIKLLAVDHVFDVQTFYLAKYQVTNAQFSAFINADDGYQNKEWWQDFQKSNGPAPSRWRESNCPREEVTWYEAVAFCRWLSHRTGNHIHLPTEWEWQQAATGGQQLFEYPWQGLWTEGKCNSKTSWLNRTSSVGLYPNGQSPHGLMDMAGNVWEWCLNKFENPERTDSLILDATDDNRVCRGGAWFTSTKNMRLLHRANDPPWYRGDGVGFRLARHLN